jgi:cell wall-associated NlpC family hydrolase
MKTEDRGRKTEDGGQKAWFNTAERIAALRAEAAIWIGTPFLCNSNTPGPRGGVSCQKLACAIYRKVGFATFQAPEVAMAHARFSKVSLVEGWMDGRREFIRVAIVDVRPGDLLGFRLARIVHHVGILLDAGEFVHVLDHVGCIVSALSDPTYSSRLAAAWRPIEI